MSYGDSLIVNGDAETGNLTGWTSSGVTVNSGGSGAGPYCFRLASTAYMYQQVAQIDFVVNPKDYRVALDFLFQNAIDPLINDASLLVIVTLHYFDGTQDEYVYSLLEDFNDSQVYGADTWYTFECAAPLSIDSVLTAVTLRVETVAANGYCQVDNIELNRSQTELEVQLRMEPTEQLPLNIAVDQTGIRGWKSNYNTPNFWLKDSGEFAFINEAADSHFIFDGTNFGFKGGIEITGGSGYVNLTDKPSQLSDINTGEGTKLTGIASGATVGATWETNLSSIPIRFANTPSGSGLFITALYMGYYASSAWQTYIANDGKFYFRGDTNNYISWDGATLTVRGKIVITGGSGLANLTDAGNLALKDIIGSIDCDATIISGGKIVTGLLTASNIQTGTLNASLVSVTNLNATNITAGTLSVARISSGTQQSGDLSISVSGWISLSAASTQGVVINKIDNQTGWAKLGGTEVFGAIYFYNSVYNLVTNAGGPGNTGYTTVAAHNHGIADGTVLRKADGTNVTWSVYGGDNHSHAVANHSHAVQKS